MQNFASPEAKFCMCSGELDLGGRKMTGASTAGGRDNADLLVLKKPYGVACLSPREFLSGILRQD
jgi:hypothetical protein